MKPMLSEGQIKCQSVCRSNEYTKHIILFVTQ